MSASIANKFVAAIFIAAITLPALIGHTWWTHALLQPTQLTVS